MAISICCKRRWPWHVHLVIIVDQKKKERGTAPEHWSFPRGLFQSVFSEHATSNTQRCQSRSTVVPRFLNLACTLTLFPHATPCPAMLSAICRNQDTSFEMLKIRCYIVKPFLVTWYLVTTPLLSVFCNNTNSTRPLHCSVHHEVSLRDGSCSTSEVLVVPVAGGFCMCLYMCSLRHALLQVHSGDLHMWCLDRHRTEAVKSILCTVNDPDSTLAASLLFWVIYWVSSVEVFAC